MIKTFHKPNINLSEHYCKPSLFPDTWEKKKRIFWKNITSIINFQKSHSRKWVLFLFVNLLSWETYASEESLPLLRVFPIYRKEECDWAIRWDVCLSCMRQGEKYAQKITFHQDGPYRVHGCFHPQKGFYPLQPKGEESKNSKNE